MNHKTEISQETKNELRDAIIEKLFVLPAFRLKVRQIQVLKTYAFSQLNINISSIDLNNKLSQAIYPYNLYQTSQSKNYFANLYNFQNSLKIIEITLKMIRKVTWIKLFISVLSVVAGYFLFRQDNIWLKLAGVIFALIFPFISITFWFDIQFLYLLVKNTFSFLHRILIEIQTYIDNMSLISSQKEEIFKDKIENISNKTVKEFIYEELRQLDYNSKKIHVFQLIIAFIMSFIVILITGDKFVILIKELANLINIATLFPIINDLNVQTFWLIFLFPLSIAWARDLVVEVSKKYSKELYQSLFIIDLYENG